MQMSAAVMNRKFRNHSFYSIEFWFIVAYYLGLKGELCQKCYWFLAGGSKLLAENVLERAITEINWTFLDGLKDNQNI